MVDTGTKTVTLTIDSETMITEGNTITLDAPPEIKDGRTYVPIEFIEPVPLTTEILEKNGFVKDENDDNMYYWNWSVIDDCMSYDKETSKVRIFSVSGLTFVKIVQYVHELQHALRLCEIKKEIEL